jgi:UDP-N-acetylglucosamine--N-acetylmuramyl-(pentapeptide) pyrophosphoryl-undecaprenol N-acetylglucosamine transferase
VAPALAVADALRAEGAEVTFIGGTRAEAQMVPAAGYELRTISVEGVSRTNPLRAVRALIRAAVALPRARRMLKELRLDAVMGGGGYVTAPVGAAALSLRIPLVLTEADSHLGLANRLLARGARCVCLAFPLPLAGDTPRGERPRGGRPRYRVTGRPIPVPDADRVSARERFGIAEGQTCVLVFGGSLGARSINLAAIEGLAGLSPSAGAESADTDVDTDTGTDSTDMGTGTDTSTEADADASTGTGADAGLRVLHISGRRDYPELSARALPSGYDLREYLDLDEFAQALAAADLVIARAGGSVAEIAAYGKPAILVPYPHASADHQSANARWMAQAGAAVVIADEQLSAARLSAEVRALLADRARLREMAGASIGLARPNAAEEIARELLEAAE